MREEEAQTILLVRAFEEADPEGRVLTREQRAIATRRAVTVTSFDSSATGDEKPTHRNTETILRRARVLRNILTHKVPGLRRVVELVRLHSLMGPAIAAVALLIGLSSNLVEPSNRVNLLSFPILVLLAWNLASYVLMLVLALGRPWLGRQVSTDEQDSRGPGDPPGHDRLAHGLAGWVVRLALWRSQVGLKQTAARTPGHAHITRRAFTRFCALWHRATGPLLVSRVRRRLHVAAGVMIIGVVVGMYLRGVALEYRATWESTWFDAPQVQRLLDWVLAPAAAVLGRAVPDVAALESPRTGPADSWLHLYAVTALLFVALPRIVLAVFEAWRGARLKRDVPVDLDEGYFRRILADWRGQTKQIEIVPYSFTPSPKTLGHVRTLLHDFFGTLSNISVQPPVGYGGAVAGIRGNFRESAEAGSGEDRYLVVLFNLAQTPESEVHGEFLEQMKAQLDPQVHLLVLVDVSSYRNQVREPVRWRERLAAWELVIRTTGLTLVDLDPDRTASDMGFADNRMAAVRAALWSAADAVEAGP